MTNKRQRKKNDNKFQFNVGEKTLEKYRKEVKNTRSKINRIKKEYGIDLSEEIKIPKLEEFNSRSEFNQWVNKVKKDFRNPKNEEYQFVKNQFGVSASKKRLKEINKKVEKERKLAFDQVNEYEDDPFISGGRVQGTVGMQRPNKTGIYVPEKFDFNDVRSIQRLDEIEERAERRGTPLYYDSRMDRMQENFIEALSGSFNTLADDLIKEIKTLPPDVFYQLYLDVDEFDFDYFDTEGQMVTADESSIGQMLSAVQLFKSGKTGHLRTDLWHENFN